MHTRKLGQYAAKARRAITDLRVRTRISTTSCTMRVFRNRGEIGNWHMASSMMWWRPRDLLWLVGGGETDTQQ